jgi:hypothetical protein
MLRSNHILGKSRLDSWVQSPLRDFFKFPTRENIAQKIESQRFSVQPRPKRRATPIYWQVFDPETLSRKVNE